MQDPEFIIHEPTRRQPPHECLSQSRHHLRQSECLDSNSHVAYTPYNHDTHIDHDPMYT